MNGIRFDNQRDLVLRTMMDRFEFLEKQMDPLDGEIKRVASDSVDFRLLMTIP